MFAKASGLDFGNEESLYVPRVAANLFLESKPSPGQDFLHQGRGQVGASITVQNVWKWPLFVQENFWGAVLGENCATSQQLPGRFLTSYSPSFPAQLVGFRAETFRRDGVSEAFDQQIPPAHQNCPSADSEDQEPQHEPSP